jgi:4-hydroxybenzoate polyprenyltransferase
VFLCTVFIYTLHYFIKSKTTKRDSRLDWCRRNGKLFFTILILSFLLSAADVVFHYKAIFFKEGKVCYRNLAWFGIIPVIALAYSYPILPWKNKSIRQVGWLKMASLSFIWSFTTVILPILILDNPKNPIYLPSEISPLFINRFFFIAAVSLLFNIYDYEEDREDNIKTLAVVLGPYKSLRWGKWMATGINIATGLFLIYSFGLHQPGFFAAIILPALLLFFYYHHYNFYEEEASFVLHHDGLMIFKVLLLIFAIAISST